MMQQDTNVYVILVNGVTARPVTRILFGGGGGGVLNRPKWTKLPKCIFYLILFNWRPVNF